MKNAMLLVTLISCLWFSPTSAAADEQMQENAQRVIVKLLEPGAGHWILTALESLSLLMATY